MRIESEKEFDRFYTALVEKDTQFVGSFYACITSTNIFCVATCTARKPKRENVLFFTTVKEALQHGFRPCKVCKPTVESTEPPQGIRDLMMRISKNPSERITDAYIRKLGQQPEKVRRWFNRNYGMTFQAYQRMIRINQAYNDMKKGSKVTSTAYSSGYESLSGFSAAVKSVFGTSPEGVKERRVINLQRFNTPIGPMYAGATEEGLCLLEFTDRRMLETEFQDLAKRLGAVIVPGENRFTKQTEEQIAEYFNGERVSFDIPLITPGTDFQKSVWEELLTIPPGKTRSYQEQAHALRKPLAIRAVARANGMNRIAIIIPCHRVIGADGNLTGYAGGLARKKWLLEHEGAISKEPGLF